MQGAWDLEHAFSGENVEKEIEKKISSQKSSKSTISFNESNSQQSSLQCKQRYISMEPIFQAHGPECVWYWYIKEEYF